MRVCGREEEEKGGLFEMMGWIRIVLFLFLFFFIFGTGAVLGVVWVKWR